MSLLNSISSFIERKRNERITVMVIPHDEAKILNLQLSILSIAFTFFVVFSVVIASYFAWTKEYSMQSQVERLHNADEEVVQKTDMFLSRYYDFRNVHESFEDNLVQFIRSNDLSSLNEIMANKEFSKITATEQLDQESLALIKQMQVQNNEEQSNPLLKDYRQNKALEEVDKNFRYSSEVVAYRSLVIDLKQTTYVINALNDLFALRQKVQRSLPVSWPTRGGHFTSFYGPRYNPINGVKREFHYGVDIANVTGTPIYAAGDGRVLVANFSSGGYGKRIKLVHRYGYSSVYAHLNSIAVSSGQYVKRGQLIGRMGSTGRSTGPHLHIEILLNGKHLNPLPFINNI